MLTDPQQFKKIPFLVPLYASKYPDSVNSFSSVVFSHAKFGFINFNHNPWSTYLLIICFNYSDAKIPCKLTPVNYCMFTSYF